MKRILFFLCAIFALSASALTYNVEVPVGTPSCFIAGEMNSWGFTEMTKVDDTHYTITFDNVTKSMKYKYCATASWDNVEMQADGVSDVQDRTWGEYDVVAAWKGLADVETETLTYNVEVPVGTPTCYIAGEMNSWGFTEMTKVDDTHYTITFDNVTKVTRYKYTCGESWYNVEMKADGVTDAPDRTWNASDVVEAWFSIPIIEQGLYMGIIGFNSELSRKSIKQLNSSNKSEFTSFINNRTMDNGTILYYAVDKAIDEISTTQLPQNLKNVAIVTFTDGLDVGSMRMDNIEDLYEDKDAYLNVVSDKIKNTKVKGVDIMSYSIGIKGDDVGSGEDRTTQFRNNLEKIASTPDNAMEVKDMAEVKEKFDEITEQLFTYSYSQTIELSTVEDVSRKIRFTFDNVNVDNISESQIYIEGDFKSKERLLTNVTYIGMTSSSGSSVHGAESGISTVFTFKDLLHESGRYYIPINNIQRWYMTSSGMWQRDSEFSSGNNTQPKVEAHSAVVMLVLDCSTSLGSTDFASLKSHSNSFINTLAQNTKVEVTDLPYFKFCQSLSLTPNKTGALVGDDITIKATLSPADASQKAVVWSISDESVASIKSVDDMNITITILKKGTTTITAETIDGSHLVASYEINAISDVETVLSDKEEAEYYNLSGLRVTKPQKGSGIYIVKQGSTVKKVVL